MLCAKNDVFLILNTCQQYTDLPLNFERQEKLQSMLRSGPIKNALSNRTP